MNLERIYLRLSFVLVFTAIVAHCIAQQALLLVIFTGTCAVASRPICEGPRGRVLPRPWSLLLTAIALIWSVVGMLGDPGQSIAWIGTFVVWLTLIKLYERRSIENEAERLILSLLLMVLAALVSVDLLFGLLLVAWTGLAITVLLLFQLYHGQELVRLQQGQVTASTEPADAVQRPIMGLGMRRDFRRVTSGILLLILGISVALFMVVPRSMTTSFSHGHGQGDVAISGHTDRVDLGGVSRISLSEEQVMSVGLLDWDGEFHQLGSPLRLRGSVLDRSRGNGVWESSERRADWEYETVPDTWQLLELSKSRTRPGADETIIQIFDLKEPLDTLFSMSRAIDVRTPISVGIDYNSNTDTLTVTSDRAPLHYEIRVLPAPPEGVLARRSWYRYQNPVVREVALGLLQEAGIPLRRPRTPAEAVAWNQQVALAFQSYLSSHEFRYTLELDRGPRSTASSELDPVERFLVIDQAGHCEYFAAAFVSLCHVVDLNARIITGFVTDRYDPLIQRYVVLKADAHAWAEVETTPGLWATFDPTPPAWTPVGRSQPPSFAQRMSWIYGWFEHAWQANVLGYDVQKQTEIVDTVQPWWRSLTRSTVTSVGEFLVTVNLAFGIGLGGYIWMGVVLVLAILSFVAWRLGRRRHQRVLAAISIERSDIRTDRRMARRYAFYVDSLRQLRDAGLAKPRWQSPGEYARKLAGTHPEVAEPLSRIVNHFYAIRFGGLDHTDEHQVFTRHALQDLSRALEPGT